MIFSVVNVTAFNFGEVQLGFNIKMPVIAPDVEKSPTMQDIKVANEQQEEKRVKARKKIKNMKSQLTCECKCWKKVVEKYSMMDNLSGSQKAHLKTTCDLQTENITKLQSGIDDCLESLLEIVSVEEGTDADGQQVLNAWVASLLEEK